MSDKTCETCDFKRRKKDKEPCDSCSRGAGYSNWYPGIAWANAELKSRVRELESQLASERQSVNELSLHAQDLAAELSDYRESYTRAMDPCPDEVHCACYPVLRMEIERLNRELANLTDHFSIVQKGARERISELMDRISDLAAELASERKISASEIETARSLNDALRKRVDELENKGHEKLTGQPSNEQDWP